MERIDARYLAVLSLSVSLAACGTAADPPLQTQPSVTEHQAIIHGEPADTGDFPSTGALLVREYTENGSTAASLCTGTLIAPDTVLTAAHCAGDDPETRRFYFYLGNDARYPMATLDLPEAPELFAAVAAVQHPYFAMTGRVGLGNAHDLALVFLDNPVVGVQPAVLLRPWERNWLEAGAPLDIVGYGVRTPPEYGIAADDELGEKYYGRSVVGELGRYELQAGLYLPTPQKCHGDSGGPSFLNTAYGPRLVGVTSRAYDPSGCTRGGVDTRPDAFYAWIEQTMQEACRQGVRRTCYPLQ